MMKVLDVAVIGCGDRIEINLLGQVVDALTRDQVCRGRVDDALLIVGNLRNHGGVCTHAHDHDVLVMLKSNK